MTGLGILCVIQHAFGRLVLVQKCSLNFERGMGGKAGAEGRGGERESERER